MPNAANRFVWYELMTTDAAAAAAFYAATVGWATRDAGMAAYPYTLLAAAGTDIGGLMAMPADMTPGAPPHWIGYVGVADVDAGARRVAAAGGALHRPGADIPGVGRFAVVADPHGAPFVLFKGQGGDAPPAAPPGSAGHVGWHELYAGDADSALAFYRAQFGWTPQDTLDMGEMGTYHLFSIDGAQSGGIMTRPPHVPAPGWLFYFNVDAIDAAADRVQAHGGRVVSGPMQVPGGSWVVRCMDPQGAVFALVGTRR